MGLILNRLYQRVGNPRLQDFIAKIDDPLQFVVEAGCHDGTDTLNLIEVLLVEKIYAFEPDPVAQFRASQLLSVHLNSTISLNPQALSNRNGFGEIEFGGLPGDGTSQIFQNNKDDTAAMKIEMLRLDDFSISHLGNGFLWLDVEGHAVPALEGAEQSLQKIDLAKIEVQMHYISPTKLADAYEVIALCRSAGLFPIYLPIQPGFFGDIYFIRLCKAKNRDIVSGFSRYLLFLLLHKYIYPILQKPAR